jgi:hypothetical protein
LASSAGELLSAALCSLPAKPADDAPASQKKRYSEQVSNVVAPAFAQELRNRGLLGARPAPPGVIGGSGAERRMAGAIGAKKVDVTWATEESGLLLALSVKTINFRDSRTGNFQKNLTNRRGDLLYEAVTLHRRFPYAVLAGFLFLDKGAAEDHTASRRSTLANAMTRLRLFDGRDDPAGRDEQYERLYVILLDATPFASEWQIFRVGPAAEQELEAPLPGDHAVAKSPAYPTVQLDEVFADLLRVVAERNPDFYELLGDGSLGRVY